MRWLHRVGIALLAVTLWAAPVSAHRLAGTRFDAPLPLPFLFAGAGLTVAVTAGWLAALTTDLPVRWQRPVGLLRERTANRLRTGGRIGFFLAFVGALGAGVFGPQVPTENFALLFVWPVWLKGIGVIAAVFGSPWRFLSPWRTLYDALVRLEGDELAVLGEYPAWLSRWPALIGFLLWIGIVENLTVIPRSPAATAGLVAGYAGVMILGGIAFGSDWFRYADTLAVLYRLFGRVAPFRFRERDGVHVLTVRVPWQACTRPFRDVSLAAFAIAAVYTVSFDGFTSTPEYQTLVFAVRDALGVGASVSVGLYLAGFALFCVAFAGIVILADIAGTASDPLTGVREFAPTVLPIAVAYEIAHNYPYVVENLASALTVIGGYVTTSSPEFAPLAWLSLSAFWVSQVTLVVGGHVIAVVASHHVATDRYGSRRRALWGHLPLTALMIGYTVLSLWIVSRPVVA